MGKVIELKPVVIDVFNFLEESGYSVTNSQMQEINKGNIRESDFNAKMLGILMENPGGEEIEKKYCFGFLRKKVTLPRIRLGKLYLYDNTQENGFVNREKERVWFLTYNGEENSGRIIELAEKIANRFDVDVKVQIDYKATKFYGGPTILD